MVMPFPIPFAGGCVAGGVACCWEICVCVTGEVPPVLVVACLPCGKRNGENAKTMLVVIAIISKTLAAIKNTRRALCFLDARRGELEAHLGRGSAEKFVTEVNVLRQRAALALNCPRVVAPAGATFRSGNKGLPSLFCCWTRVGIFAAGRGGVFFSDVERSGGVSGTVRIL